MAAHAFHRWPERRICRASAGRRHLPALWLPRQAVPPFSAQHIHVGVTSADEAIWLTGAHEYVPAFIALSAASPFVDGVDTLFQSARLNAVSAFPLSGQCRHAADWHDFLDRFRLLQDCGIAKTSWIFTGTSGQNPNSAPSRDPRVYAALGRPGDGASQLRPQSLYVATCCANARVDAEGLRHVARCNKFQACRYGRDAQLELACAGSAVAGGLDELMILLDDDAVTCSAAATGCTNWPMTACPGMPNGCVEPGSA